SSAGGRVAQLCREPRGPVSRLGRGADARCSMGDACAAGWCGDGVIPGGGGGGADTGRRESPRRVAAGRVVVGSLASGSGAGAAPPEVGTGVESAGAEEGIVRDSGACRGPGIDGPASVARSWNRCRPASRSSAVATDLGRAPGSVTRSANVRTRLLLAAS